MKWSPVLGLASGGGRLDLAWQLSASSEGPNIHYVSVTVDAHHGAVYRYSEGVAIPGRPLRLGADGPARCMLHGPVGTGPTLAVAGLKASHREALAQYWARVGTAEHASIAAFARHVTELQRLGAPDTMVKLAVDAVAEEAVHTALAFELASRYAGRPLVPPRLPPELFDPEEPTDHEAVLRRAVVDGCINETLAAHEAIGNAGRVRDPVVRVALERIARDETRHAELAWAFVAWAASRDPQWRAVVHDAFAHAIPRWPTGPTGRDPQLVAHGLMDRHTRCRAWAHGWRTVIRPCTHALLHGASGR